MSSSSAAWPDGVGRLILEEVDSTNAEGARRAPGLLGPTWILARRQTSGRGRGGRAWADPPGNFAATLVTPCRAPAAELALRSFVAALALHEALAGAIQSEPAAPARDTGALTLKWPNDVLLDGGKLAGILLEAGRPAGVLLTGYGVNLAAMPDKAGLAPGARQPVSLLGRSGLCLTPEALLDRLAPAHARWQARLDAEGFAPIRAAWLSRAHGRGAQLTARLPRRCVTGRFEDLDQSGALILSTETGRVAIAAGDVYP